MKTKKIILDFLIVVFILALLILIYYFFINRNSYYNIEKRMVKQAKDYILKNDVKVENQEYIFLDNLKIDNTELCSKVSGVIVTKIDNNIKYTPYLKCSDYESKIINNDNSFIELNGKTVELVKKGSIYLDKGFKKNKNVEVVTIGEVPDEIGAYTINYVIKENNEQVALLKRIVIVSNYDNDLVELKESPVITLNGEENMILALNEEYKEQGFLAYDSRDGNLTSKVKIDNNKIDTKKIGSYEIKYSVTNSNGQKVSVSRFVKVVNKKSNLEITAEIKKENENQFIELKISGNGFKKVILPDEKMNKSTIIQYNITENGKYVFKIIDEYNNEIEKTVIVETIDKDLPTGECVATRGEKAYTIKVKAQDNTGIKGIIYIVNDNESGLFNSYEYKTPEIITKAEVVIIDLSNNKNKVTCTIND